MRVCVGLIIIHLGSKHLLAAQNEHRGIDKYIDSKGIQSHCPSVVLSYYSFHLSNEISDHVCIYKSNLSILHMTDTHTQCPSSVSPNLNYRRSLYVFFCPHSLIISKEFRTTTSAVSSIIFDDERFFSPNYFPHICRSSIYGRN